jgi:hypothetical protein
VTRTCPYCAHMVFGAGLVSCRGCGSPISMGPIRERSETMEIAVAVNKQAKERIVFGGDPLLNATRKPAHVLPFGPIGPISIEFAPPTEPQALPMMI